MLTAKKIKRVENLLKVAAAMGVVAPVATAAVGATKKAPPPPPPPPKPKGDVDLSKVPALQARNQMLAD